MYVLVNVNTSFLNLISHHVEDVIEELGDSPMQQTPCAEG